MNRIVPTYGKNCDPDAIRTRDRLLRRQMLYPAELPDPLTQAQNCRLSISLISPD